ncbi:REP-associated tyrosine transposase [Pseudomonas turukhanskensis]|uniref:Transposase n=1 Tax=Pseudomonas turukhanskensis TaxID=1806536 RepID=A0A9W6KC34_9PSED|nr:transposase [Pseudomonas turukhanskensis]GLK91919.1 transposase [Pseudomonas turukhanskensis]
MRYRRAWVPGGTYFFTLALHNRSQTLLTDHIDLLRNVMHQVRERHPFETLAAVVLPDHLHCVWQLPDGDYDFATRWALIKAAFSRQLPRAEPISLSRNLKRERGIWQRRYWEHCIREQEDLERHIDYIHFNPVKHGHADRASEWPYSSIHRYIRQGLIAEDWAG